MVRKLGWIALLIVGAPVFAQHHPDKPAIHGMLLKGRGTIYASHLPMFHSPHDYQIILKLKFDDAANQRYLQDRKVHTEEPVYTIEPEVFVLPEMVNRTKKFKAKVYRGHFERKGVMIAEDVHVTIEQVIYFKHFKDDERKPVHLKYILFGNDKEQFLAHQISASPDFDEVLAMKIEKDKTDMLKKSPYKIIEFDENDIRTPFSWNTNSIEVDSKKIKFTDHKTLYLEFGDLE
jgi:hypothetical protein